MAENPVFASDQESNKAERMAQDDTICAIATPPGQGGIGVVRISGPQAVAMADRITRLRTGRSLVHASSHRLYLGEVVPITASAQAPRLPQPDRSPSTDAQEPLDTALVVVMRGPHSYTGEDVVEFQCHGAPVLLRRVCELLLQAGARVAEPGEFSKRAFLNGRLDLVQAEGVLDTIQARTEESLRIARELARGVLSEHVSLIQEGLTSLLAQIEAGIDFVEEDVTVVSSEEVLTTLRQHQDLLAKLLGTWESGRLFRQGAKVVIVGKPNVGKSSLLNALVQYDRAIVTPIPGTTRDLLEEEITLNGIPLRLVDTAGMRETDDPVEREGVRRTGEAIKEADVTLVLVDGSSPLEEGDRAILRAVSGTLHLVVINKSDRPDVLTADDHRILAVPGASARPVRLSAKTGQGLDDLRQGIVDALPRAADPGEGPTITRLRHYEALTRAREALAQALQTAQQGLSGEFLAVDLRAVVTALGELTGSVTTDDLLDRIFSQFCIGK